MHNDVHHFPCSASRGFHNGATLYCSLDFGHDTPCDFVVDSRSFAGGQTQNTLWAPGCNQPPHAGPCNGFPCEFVTKLVELGIYPLKLVEQVVPPNVYMGYEWPYDEETEEEKKKMHIDPTVAVAYGVAIVFSALVLLSYFRRDK